MISVEVRDEEFQSWLERTRYAFTYMLETMKDVARVVMENTIPITPMETTRLRKSFKWTVVTNNSKMKVLQIQMSALNPKTGYDYAWIQHENIFYEHPSKYSKIYDYEKMSKINMTSSSTGYHSGGKYISGSIFTNTMSSHFLRDGIRYSEDMAYELIEEDYLSLFLRGNIF